MTTYDTQFTNYMQGGPRRISPFFIPMLIPDIAAGNISIKYGFKGPNYATVSACATASHAIGDAFRIIQYGDADAMVCGGSEAPITPMGLGGFNNIKALSGRNDAPEKASRPFDAQRDGFVMGEGAGALILEELEFALKRGAKIYARDRRPRLHRGCAPYHRPPRRRRRRRPLHAQGDEGFRHFTRPGGLHQRPRHLHAAQRHQRNPGNQDRLRRPRRTRCTSAPPSR